MHSRTTEELKDLARVNRKKLDDATAEKMAGRTLADGYLVSRLNTDFFLGNDEAILHVVGNAHVRAIFIEYFDRRFELYSVDARQDILDGIPLDIVSYHFVFKKPTLLEARKQFLQMGSYFFGCCIPKADIKSLTDRFSKETLAFNAFDAKINEAFSHLVEWDDPNDRYLSLFDRRKAQNIKSATTKYDQFLEEWNKPLIWDFSALHNENARKVLQLFKNYLSGGLAGRFFSGKWKHHHCDEIASVLTKYSKSTLLEAPTRRAQPIKRKANSVSDLLVRRTHDEMELVSLHENLADATVIDVLRTLKLEIIDRNNTEIKTHGDLFALLQVIKDYTDIDYFALPDEPAPAYMDGLRR